MQHCDTFLGTLFLSPHTERQRPSQRWFRMRLAWWISLLSLFIDHWVTRAVASADKPTPAFLMTQEPALWQSSARLASSDTTKSYACVPAIWFCWYCPHTQTVLSFLSLLSPCFPQEGRFCLREGLHCMQDKHFSLTFSQRVQILKKFGSWPVRVVRLWL